jgi:hypothetical protein
VTTPEPQVPIIPGQPYQPPTPQSQPPPLRPAPKKGLSAGAVVGIILGGVGLLGLLCCAGLFYLGNIGGGGGTAKSDGDVVVRLDSCTLASGFYRANLTVTNNGTRARSVYVDIEWLDPGNGDRLASTTEIVRSVDPGQTAKEETIAMGADDRAAVRCTYRVR